MNSGSSACIGSHGHSVVTILAASWYQRSRVGFILTAPPVRLTTTTQSTPDDFSSAASTLAFSATLRPPRRPSSAVMTILDSQSLMRCAGVSGGKPGDTPGGGGPGRAQGGGAGGGFGDNGRE